MNWMCSNYTYKKNEVKLRLRDKILVFGAVPRANIRPTDLGPVIVPEYEGFACRESSTSIVGTINSCAPCRNSSSVTRV